jgi:hypothetical protein
LLASESLVASVVQMVLDAYFSESLHVVILVAVGLTSFAASSVVEEQTPYDLQENGSASLRALLCCDRFLGSTWWFIFRLSFPFGVC